MTDIHEMPGHLIRRLHQISVAVFMAETAAAGFDLTPVQYAAMRMIEAHPGIDQATLAGLIAYDRTTIGGVVDRLEQKGYVERAVSGRDRRARKLRVLDAGRDLLRAVEPVVAKVQRIMLSSLDVDEGRLLVALLQKATTSANELSRAPLRSVPLAAGEEGVGTSG